MTARRRPPRARLVTLSTDLGSAYTAQMKAVLCRSIEAGRVVELTHDLRPHDLLEAAFVVRAMAIGFPAGSVHLVIVDPGVGGSRAALAIQCRDGSVLIGPDNGVLGPLAHALGRPRGFRIGRRRLPGPARVGTTFDGRDVFAPAAAFVATGGRPDRLGPPKTPIALHLPRPARSGDRAKGEVLHVDHFGNLVTNIPTEWVPPATRRVQVRVGRRGSPLPWVTSYERLGRGRRGALGSSFGTVELAVDRGDAARAFAAGPGTPVTLRWAPGDDRSRQSVNSDRPRRR